MYTFRTLTPSEYASEFPDEELEQESPSTDVGEDEEEESEDSKETASDALAKAFERVAKGQTVKTEAKVTERKIKTTAPAEPKYTQESAAVALSSAIRKARGI